MAFPLSLQSTGFTTKVRAPGHIDWKIYGRTDKLFAKQYEEETNLRCLIAVDTSSSMFYPADTRAKIRSIALRGRGFGHDALSRQRDAVGLCLFSDKIETPPIKSLLHTLKAVHSSRTPQSRPERATSKPTWPKYFRVAENIHKRSLVVIFNDMFDGDDNTEELFKALNIWSTTSTK